MIVDKSRCELLHEIMAVDFKLYDLQLYLDTHPFDEDALCMYQNLVNDADELTEEYEEKYGPLTPKSAAGNGLKIHGHGRGGKKICGDMRKNCNTL